MRRILLIGSGSIFGALLAYVLDPDRGRSRRARLKDQAAASGRRFADKVRKTAEYQTGLARGVVHEVSDTLSPENEYNDESLLQKVRSEALGYWDGSEPIEVDITDGMVKVKGSVRDRSSRDQLIDLIRDVEGVDLVDDRLTVG